MINRISEIPFWGPEEQIRRFVNQHDEMSELYDDALRRLVPPVSEAEIKTLDTADKKKNKLKERIVELFVPPTISSNKFTIDGIIYSISSTKVTWTDLKGVSKTSNIVENKFTLEDGIEYTRDSNKVKLTSNGE